MPSRGGNHHAFSYKYQGIVKELRTPVRITAALTSYSTIDIKNLKSLSSVWDTGATNSVISPRVARDMNLSPTGFTTVRGVNSQRVVKTYIIDLILPFDKVIIQNLNVSESDIGGDLDVLIGMDVIQMGDFNISNAGGITNFSYCIPPHKKPTCLVEKSNMVNSGRAKSYDNSKRKKRHF